MKNAIIVPKTSEKVLKMVSDALKGRIYLSKEGYMVLGSMNINVHP